MGGGELVTPKKSMGGTGYTQAMGELVTPKKSTEMRRNFPSRKVDEIDSETKNERWGLRTRKRGAQYTQNKGLIELGLS